MKLSAGFQEFRPRHSHTLHFLQQDLECSVVLIYSCEVDGGEDGHKNTQIPESTTTRWGCQYCVCVRAPLLLTVQQLRNKAKPVRQTGRQTDSSKVHLAAVCNKLLLLFSSSSAAGVPQLPGRLRTPPARQALAEGPRCLEDRRQPASWNTQTSADVRQTDEQPP